MNQPSALRHLTFTIALFFFVLPAFIHAQNTPDRSEIFSNVENLIDDQQYDEALHLLESFINSDDPHIRTKALRISGQIHLSEREINSAVDKLNRSLNLSRTIFNRTEEAWSLYHLARAAIQSESFELAKRQAEEAAVIAKHLGDEMLTYRIQNFLTYIHYMTDTDFYKILDLETDVFHLVRRIGTPQQKAAAINNLGYDLTVAGTVPLDSTIALMNVANTLYAEMEGHNGRWYTLMNLTWQHRLKNNLEASVKFGEMSLGQALTEEDRHAVIEAAFQLGETLMEMDKLDEAARQYEIGRTWRGIENDRDGFVFDVYYSKFLWNAGKQNEAVSLLEKAVDWLQQSKVFYEMHGRALLASYYLENDQSELAKQQLDILHDPRHNYISIETRCMSAIVHARLLIKNQKKNLAEALLKSWRNHTRQMGMNQLTLWLDEAFPGV